MNGFGRPEDLERPEFIQLKRELEQYVGAADLHEGELAWSRRWEYPWAITNAELQDGMRVLDAGAGHTTFGLYLAHQRKARYCAADPDAGFRAGFVAHAQRLGVDVDYRLDSLEKTSFESGSFDRIFCISVLEHLPYDVAMAAFTEWRRLLKPGGLLVLTMDVNFSDTSRQVEVARLPRLLQAPGFKVRGNEPRVERPEDGIFTNRPFWGTRFWPFDLQELRILGRHVAWRIHGLEPSVVGVIGVVYERLP